jgi:hypothetical protein
MTRNPSSDPQQLEREYVYAPEPISFSELADRHGLARSNVADKARIGQWYKKRQEYQRQVSRSVVEAMGEKWAQQGVALREKVIHAAETTLDKYIELLDNDKIKPDAKDAATMAAVVRTFLADIAEAAKPNQMIVDGDAVEWESEEAAREAVDVAKRALAEAGVRLLGEGTNGTSHSEPD